MFDEEKINEYKNIVAPTQLRSRVMAYAQHPKERKANPRMLRNISVLAASLMIVLGIYLFSSFRNTDHVKVSINGQTLTSTGIVLNSENYRVLTRMRSTETYNIPMTFTLQRQSEIAVSEGEIILIDRESGEIQTGTTLTAKGEVEIGWNISSSVDSTECEMTVKNDKESCLILLSYDAVTDTYMICCDKE